MGAAPSLTSSSLMRSSKTASDCADAMHSSKDEMTLLEAGRGTGWGAEPMARSASCNQKGVATTGLFQCRRLTARMHGLHDRAIPEVWTIPEATLLHRQGPT
jgi:hypothetical protein